MHRKFLALFAAVAMSLPATAQVAGQDEADTVFGGDRYLAGTTVMAAEPTDGDLFAAGERITVAAPVGGSTHIAGRRLRIEAPIGGALYAVGYAVRVDAPVAGAATLAGAEVMISDQIGGNLRASGREVSVEAPVMGSAILAGAEVVLSGAISGDAAIAAETILFEDGASVAGQLRLYVDDPDAFAVPASVAAAERIEILDANEFEREYGDTWDGYGPSFLSRLARFVIGVVVVAVIALLVVLAMPVRMAEMRQQAWAHPWRSLWSGILGLSTIIGFGVVAALTVIGIPLLPAALLVGAVAGLGGYILGTYFLGGALWQVVAQAPPQALMQKTMIAALGALVAALIGLIPYLGWLFMLALALAGLGVILGKLRSRQPVSY